MSEETQTGVAEATPEVKPVEQAPAETTAAETTPASQEQVQEPVATTEEQNEQLPPPPEEIPVPEAVGAAPALPAVKEAPDLPAPEKVAEQSATSDAPSGGAAPKKPASPKPNRGPKPQKQGKPQTKGFMNHDEKMKWIAARHAKNQQQLLKAGYPSPIVMEVMRFMQSNNGYENYAKDNLINCLCRLGENLLYRLDTFTVYNSADLMISINDIYCTLTSEPKLRSADKDEAMRITQSIIDTRMKPRDDKMSGILKHALGIKFVEGYAGRAVYLFECLIDISMKMLDPFSGHMHDQRLKVPEELKKFYGPKKAKCRKCGRTLVYDKQQHGLVCMNEMCEEYKIVNRKRREDGDENGGGFRDRNRDRQPMVSSAPVPQESQSEKFSKRFGKRGNKPFQKKHRPEKEPVVKTFPPPGSSKQFENKPFAGLTLPGSSEGGEAAE